MSNLNDLCNALDNISGSISKKKYESTGEELIVDGIVLHRIKRVSDGQLGGWIEKESNLSHEGKCWVDGNSRVWGNARIAEDARIDCDACVFDNAYIHGRAYISSYSKVYGNANIYGEANICGHDIIFDNAEIYDDVRINGFTQIYGNAKIHGITRLKGYGFIYGSADLYKPMKYTGFYSIMRDDLNQDCDPLQQKLRRQFSKTHFVRSHRNIGTRATGHLEELTIVDVNGNVEVIVGQHVDFAYYFARYTAGWLYSEDGSFVYYGYLDKKPVEPIHGVFYKDRLV